jgi:hypothetical protein
VNAARSTSTWPSAAIAAKAMMKIVASVGMIMAPSIERPDHWWD